MSPMPMGPTSPAEPRVVELALRVEAEPVAQARPRTFMQGGRIVTYSPGSPWKTRVFAAALPMRPKRPLDGPLAVRLVFYLPRPRRARPGAVWAPSRPDWDNLAKGTTDSLTAARWWVDDARIVAAAVEKRYADEKEAPGCLITVYRMA